MLRITYSTASRRLGKCLPEPHRSGARRNAHTSRNGFPSSSRHHRKASHNITAGRSRSRAGQRINLVGRRSNRPLSQTCPRTGSSDHRLARRRHSCADLDSKVGEPAVKRTSSGTTGSRRRLTGNRCQCCVCEDYFSSPRTFSRHRLKSISTWRCLTEVEMFEAGWIRNPKGFWLTPDPRRAGADKLSAFDCGGATPLPLDTSVVAEERSDGH